MILRIPSGQVMVQLLINMTNFHAEKSALIFDGDRVCTDGYFQRESGSPAHGRFQSQTGDKLGAAGINLRFPIHGPL